jgi:hypothetical protein
VALLFTPAAIQTAASTTWKPKKIDKDVGFIELNKDINVTIEGNRIVTRVAGQWKQLGVPNISFTLTGSGLLALNDEMPPRLTATGSSQISNPIVDIFPILSAEPFSSVIFWAGGDLVEDLVATTDTLAAGKLAAQWPIVVLTPIIPPALRGKLTFTWKPPVVDGRGVRTVGILDIGPRTPSVSIEGPATVTAELPSNSAQQDYYFYASDLRGHLVIRWRIDGALAGRDFRQVVNFESPRGIDPVKIHRQVQVNVYDVDGLMATHERSIEFDVIDPEGKLPY